MVCDESLSAMVTVFKYSNKKIPVVTITGIFYSLKEDDYRMATSFALLFMLYLARVQSRGRQYQYGSRYHPNG